MDEALVETELPSAGERLRAAREEKGMNLEDIAAQTRIPQRHLESLETSIWDKLPAPTYTIGFARSYATAIGLDRTEISDQLRTEMGGTRPVTATAEVFEPADPARTMPKWLVFGTVAAVLLLVVVMSWLNKRSLDLPDDANNSAAEAPPPAPQPPAAAPTAGPQQVVLNATAPVWVRISERGGGTLFSGILAAGQAFPVPQTATAPLLSTAKAEALRINVGDKVAPPVGPPATKVSNVSLLPADLMRGGQPQTQQVAATPPPSEPRSRPTSRTRLRHSTAGSAPAARTPVPQPVPPTNTTG